VSAKAIAHRATRQVSRVLAELIDLEVASVWRRHVAVRLMTVFQTPAGTRSFARISWRSDVNSEIVLVATESLDGGVLYRRHDHQLSRTCRMSHS
jgi:hypothetical protein